jgi:hypothetical protein
LLCVPVLMLFAWLFLVLAQDSALRIADPSAQTRIRASEPSGGTGVTPSGRAVPRDGRPSVAALAFMAFMALLAFAGRKRGSGPSGTKRPT